MSSVSEHPSHLSAISVVIPVYKSASTLPELYERLLLVLPTLAPEWEILLVNDGSPDLSWETIERLAGKHPEVRGICLMRNYGQHNAVLCGLRAARYPLIVTMDDDLQHPPEEIPVLLNELQRSGMDVVYGVPQQEQHGLWRDLASQITKFALQAAMGAQIARKVSAFRILRHEVCQAFANYQGPYVSIDVLMTWGTNRFGSVVVRHEPRKVGKTNYTFRKLVVHALNMLTGFSTFPLRIASLVGFFFTFFGIVVFGYVIGRYLVLGYSVPGFPFLASIIAIFAGAQLFALGIIGEYLARMYFRSMERPSYSIRTELKD
jgi:glycosyltransferase involved in cell wall biosynthesis